MTTHVTIERNDMPSIVEALKFRTDQMCWTDSDMARELGLSKSHYSEIINGKRRLPLGAVKWAFGLGVPAKVLLQP